MHTNRCVLNLKSIYILTSKLQVPSLEEKETFKGHSQQMQELRTVQNHHWRSAFTEFSGIVAHNRTFKQLTTNSQPQKTGLSPQLLSAWLLKGVLKSQAFPFFFPPPQKNYKFNHLDLIRMIFFKDKI